VQQVQVGLGLGLGGQGLAELGLGGQGVLGRLPDHSLEGFLTAYRLHCSKNVNFNNRPL